MNEHIEEAYERLLSQNRELKSNTKFYLRQKTMQFLVCRVVILNSPISVFWKKNNRGNEKDFKSKMRLHEKEQYVLEYSTKSEMQVEARG